MGANTAASVKQAQAGAYATATPFQALYSTAPTTSAGTELTGGTPAYARKATAWTAQPANPISTTGTFDVASGSTVAGTGFHSAATAGNYLDGVALTSQTFSSQGTYAATVTVTVS